MEHTPAGTSVHNMIHWTQLVNSGNFQMFDYGAVENMKIYHQATPPLYAPQNLTHPPLAFFTGSRDELADPVDVQKLLSVLPESNKPVLVHNEPTYEHLGMLRLYYCCDRDSIGDQCPHCPSRS
jgi:hypothetical protein